MTGQITSIHDAEYLGEKSSIQEKVEQIFEAVPSDADNNSAIIINEEAPPKVEASIETDNQSASNMKDAIEGLFDSVEAIERFLRISAKRKTWIVTPLAIYHENPS